MALIEEPGQHATQWSLLVEETDAADANRMVAAGAESGDHVGSFENARPRSRRFAARKLRGK